MAQPDHSDLEQRLSFSEQYENLGLIGSGGQGKVYKIRDKRSNEVLAVKRIGLDSWEEVRRLEDEVHALRQLQHPAIVASKGSYAETDRWNDPEFLLFMEYVDGKPLVQHLAEGRQFSEEELIDMQKQLVAGLTYAHRQGIVHRDIKPHNILLKEDGTVKITDYGLAKFLNEGTRSTSLGKGTISYMAPEQINGGRIKPDTDYYGLGLTLLSLALGKERSDDIRHQKPKDDLAKLRSQKRYSPAFLDSLESLVDENPEKRKSGLVVKKPEPVLESASGNLETVVNEKKTYGELVKYKKVGEIKRLHYSMWGTVFGFGGGLASILLAPPELINYVGPVSVGSVPAGTYLGYKWSQVTNWRRRRKAEKAAGVMTLTNLQDWSEDEPGHKFLSSKKLFRRKRLFKMFEYQSQQYLLEDSHLGSEEIFIPPGSGGRYDVEVPNDLPKIYALLDYNPEKGEAHVQEVSNKNLFESLLGRTHTPIDHNPEAVGQYARAKTKESDEEPEIVPPIDLYDQDVLNGLSKEERKIAEEKITKYESERNERQEQQEQFSPHKP